MQSEQNEYQSLLFQFSRGDSNSVIKLRGLDSAKVNDLDKDEMSPLHYAVDNNHYDAVKVLVEDKHAGLFCS